MSKDVLREDIAVAVNDMIKDNVQTKTYNSLASNLSFSFKDDV